MKNIELTKTKRIIRVSDEAAKALHANKDGVYVSRDAMRKQNEEDEKKKQ